LVMKTTISTVNRAPNPFVTKHQANIAGVLQGFDRLRLQGTLRSLYYPAAMAVYLKATGVTLTQFKTRAASLTERVRNSAIELARRLGRPFQYLCSSRIDKEQVARDIAERDQVRSGLVAVFSCLEPGYTWKIFTARQQPRLELRRGQCLHIYFYQIDPEVGWMNLRLQTWYPFLVQIALNGREWLTGQMDKAGLAYRRYRNSISWTKDWAQAQQLLDEQMRADWTKLGDRLVQEFHPVQSDLTAPLHGQQYYWTVAESEYATDVAFHEPEALEKLYPHLVHHAITSYQSRNVLRFLGKGAPCEMDDFTGEVRSNLRQRPEGVRVKHWVNGNSIKFYNKQNLLRVEVTLNRPEDFKVYRGSELDKTGRKQWRPLRRSVADLHRRAEISRGGTERYLTALAAVNQSTPLATEVVKICQPVTRDGRRYRALNPWGPQDAKLLELINDGHWALAGFRNRDLRSRLYPVASPDQEAKRAAALGRRLTLLRAHGLIRKVSSTHRYHVTEKGRRIITALMAARAADVAKLTQLALAA
jgi:hypothetical protein